MCALDYRAEAACPPHYLAGLYRAGRLVGYRCRRCKKEFVFDAD